MENAGYVITGWVLTGVVLAGYGSWIARRVRRAARALDLAGPPSDQQ